ncbi:protein ripply2 [Suricata suricatta]|uniref:protein ripply2 n=1 Tax=Suricata suricatta TaxID=37032 RepID=UPI0011553901|nr:protein ripply2 [Suricata suricatta]
MMGLVPLERRPQELSSSFLNVKIQEDDSLLPRRWFSPIPNHDGILIVYIWPQNYSSLGNWLLGRMLFFPLQPGVEKRLTVVGQNPFPGHLGVARVRTRGCGAPTQALPPASPELLPSALRPPRAPGRCTAAGRPPPPGLAASLRAFCPPPRRSSGLWRPWVDARGDQEEGARHHAEEAMPVGPGMTEAARKLSQYRHPVRLFWPKSKCYDYLYQEAEALLKNFPIQATISFYEDSDSEDEIEELTCEN